MATLSQRIRTRREQLGITQEELADMVNKSQKQIWQYESGKVQPSAGVLVLFANALETTTDYLLGRSDQPGQPVNSIDELDDLELETLEMLRSQRPDQREKIVNAIRALT